MSSFCGLMSFGVDGKKMEGDVERVDNSNLNCLVSFGFGFGFWFLVFGFWFLVFGFWFCHFVPFG